LGSGESRSDEYGLNYSQALRLSKDNNNKLNQSDPGNIYD